ncbi:MAG: hypothetical protein HY300_08575 [Verrucomicrobia bacterium]|nr:hypothetical protein [Verrucomicrobiota bacterium]
MKTIPLHGRRFVLPTDDGSGATKSLGIIHARPFASSLNAFNVLQSLNHGSAPSRSPIGRFVMHFAILFVCSSTCCLTAFAQGGTSANGDFRPPLQVRHNNDGLITLFDGSGEKAQPIFNMLIPEYIKVDGVDAVPEHKKPRGGCFFHTQPSKWEKLGDNRWRMSQDYPEYLKFEVVLTTTPDAVYLAWRIRNYRKEPIKKLSGDFCCGCKNFLAGKPVPELRFPNWEELVFKQASVYSPTKGWRTMEQGNHGVSMIACRSLNGKKILAHASDRIGDGSHAVGNTCIHHSSEVSDLLDPGQWSPWQRRAVYLLDGTLDDLLGRYRRDFAEGATTKDKWPE